MSKKSRNRESQGWLKEHLSDVYVKQAVQSGYRSRAVYKLAQIDARDRLFHSGMTVVDLGAAPGGWSQWLKQRLQNQVRVFALDILYMEPLPEVTFIQGDFREQVVLDNLLNQLGEHPVDLVMSDMAPNISGLKAIDQPRAMLLAELARDLAYEVLASGGHLLTKVFQGEGFESYIKALRPHFKNVVIRKPEASRSRSAEVYVLAKHYVAK
ncbi:MAG: 23S rRNA (uridine(2552)-2'-O)-methyltransferase RlmE [Candidatus Parabeggiatoa sp. nov. 3]|nr:MAG: 23S rRNA (uridine(2552)-2'-O)-methyltransferase RlmE [Gammaproteobacteria bacterium]RKZ64707.1 MAG: 23S rRNA (uridine(2552)-2'-O)-methyltransferase RlmE [Gammaproteobacteria bacterium]RKZ78338.1 MAG: 23S rRNA (uridine(2552)-2'-O)-methyltransferase RlmE [Gammaproteobacteria bacterium]HEW97222.1 23S rRNA (uridine(2552)-2'-O)-methyltransferase RlmE [Beggiatoa sp.]